MRSFLVCLCFTLVSMVSAIAEDPIRVMSFNIRYGLAKDGENEWQKRTDLLINTIHAFQPDLLGTQETLKFQADFLRENLPEYGYVGRTRDTDPNGEQCAIFYRKGRFERIAFDQFWLSKTPDQPASKSWDSSLPRVVTLVILKEKKSNRELTFYNTHFDHRGSVARFESARLLRTNIEARQRGTPVIVTGDFNCGQDSRPYAELVGSPQLHDSFRLVYPQTRPNEGTFNGFQGTMDGARIDWVLHSAEFQPVGAAIDHTNSGGRYPSDHFPVTALLEWRSSPNQP